MIYSNATSLATDTRLAVCLPGRDRLTAAVLACHQIRGRISHSSQHLWVHKASAAVVSGMHLLIEAHPARSSWSVQMSNGCGPFVMVATIQVWSCAR